MNMTAAAQTMTSYQVEAFGRPLAKVMRSVRCSMLAGLASKASPSSSAARPL
jgi:hypothetical protein